MISTLVEGIFPYSVSIVGLGPYLVLDGFHAIEPFVLAGRLDDGDQPVFHVLTAAETCSSESSEEALFAVLDFCVQGPANRTVEGFEVRQPGGPDEERVTVCPGILVIEIAIRVI